MQNAKSKTIDEYIAGFPEGVQTLLNQIRATVKELAHEAEETISYGIPTFRLHGQYLLYFAGYKNHISLYPAPRGHDDFKTELSGYKGGKGTVQFPLDRPLPLELIKKIVLFRIRENETRKKGKNRN